MSQTTTQAVSIRWLTRRDLACVLEIERNCFEVPWAAEDFIQLLRQRNVIGMVAERRHRILGFMVYGLKWGELELLNFAVDPLFQRQSVGAQMIERLRGKLPQQRRSSIELMVRETNLEAQFFFRAMGFRAERVERDFYEGEDGYRLVYRLPEVSR
jgi:[ribosomal protein S18]-alanine N-acetyltransferase